MFTHCQSSSGSFECFAGTQHAEELKISDREALLFLKCFKNPKVNKLCSLYLGENNISSQVKSQLVCSFLEESFYWEQSHGKLCL